MRQQLDSLKWTPPSSNALQQDQASLLSTLDDSDDKAGTVSHWLNKQVWKDGDKELTHRAVTTSLTASTNTAAVETLPNNRKPDQDMDSLTSSLKDCHLATPTFDFINTTAPSSSPPPPPVFAPARLPNKPGLDNKHRKILPRPTPRRERLGAHEFQALLQRSKEAVAAPRVSTTPPLPPPSTSPLSTLKRRPSFESLDSSCSQATIPMATTSIPPAKTLAPPPTSRHLTKKLPGSSPTKPLGVTRKKKTTPYSDFDVFCHLIALPLDSDDWVCLSCQYRIFVHGWKKVLQHRRKMQRKQRQLLAQLVHQQQHEHHCHHHHSSSMYQQRYHTCMPSTSTTLASSPLQPLEDHENCLPHQQQVH
ncbi:hypothetical protein DM01DRAFT_1333846 [Hesseltinella vesiculosa]|uniref:Uncharacterized protein n=1 Tax=Hesseltinella vesiculosa TaxID=101127 RepID=A0A1X2GNT6_9FUNG|nr:hypothetical protein DM01DRAFT_1333846 [Hesseltinella vesiculosa]